MNARHKRFHRCVCTKHALLPCTLTVQREPFNQACRQHSATCPWLLLTRRLPP
jgi:hypothetical protein